MAHGVLTHLLDIEMEYAQRTFEHALRCPFLSACSLSAAAEKASVRPFKAYRHLTCCSLRTHLSPHLKGPADPLILTGTQALEEWLPGGDEAAAALCPNLLPILRFELCFEGAGIAASAVGPGYAPLVGQDRIAPGHRCSRWRHRWRRSLQGVPWSPWCPAG